MADSELIVRLRGENSDLKAKLAEVTKASTSSASSMASSFKSALGTIGGAIGVAFSVRAVVDFAKQSVMAFAETEAAAVSLAGTISNLGGSAGVATGIQGMVDSLEKMSGFDDADISEAFRDLSIQTGSSEKATAALNVAMDLAAREHTTVAVAAANVHNVMLGLSRTMKNYGMVTRDGATDMDYLREMGAKMSGGLSANLDTLDGKTRVWKTSWDNLKESIGQALAPAVGGAMEKMTAIFNNIAATGAWNEWLTTLSEADQSAITNLGAGMGYNWRRAFMEAINGDESLWDNAVMGAPPSARGAQSSFGNPTPTVVGSTAGTAMAKAFQASWSPISLMGGNLPELTKYIGNLRQVSTIKQKVTVDVEMTINGGSVVVKNSSPVAKAIVKAIVPAVQAAITHGQGWKPGSGGGDSLVRYE